MPLFFLQTYILQKKDCRQEKAQQQKKQKVNVWQPPVFYRTLQTGIISGAVNRIITFRSAITLKSRP